MDANEKIKAAYALNLWTVSISQIIAYNDVNVLEQEYNTIMNNLNLENIIKADALLDVIKEILDEITYLRMDYGDQELLERKYQHQLKNAVWDAVPSIGAIFVSKDPRVVALNLASQVGIGYMNYRRNKAEYQRGFEEAEWNIQKNRMEHLNGLQKQLFETAWRLAEEYDFKDQYRLTQKQITSYNEALMEENAVRRFNRLDTMKDKFDAYPAFWYQIGSTANSIYRSELFVNAPDVRQEYKTKAIEYFKKYGELNTFKVIREDIITASWALEYLELLDMNYSKNAEEAKSLIQIAENNAGNSFDVLELCAFAYLRIADEENAVRLFHRLVNESYNTEINVQILSGLYIKRMRNPDTVIAHLARVGYLQLPEIVDYKHKKYILENPTEIDDLSNWKPVWNREDDFEEFIAQKKQEHHAEKIQREETRKKASTFYKRPIKLVCKSQHRDIAEHFVGVLNENMTNIGTSFQSATWMDLKEYQNKRQEIDGQGYHVILLGDSDEAKRLYKTAKNGRWDYYHLGMRFVSYGNKTVLLARKIKNEQIDDLIRLAREKAEKYIIKIPRNAKTINYSFAQHFYEEKIVGSENAFKHILATIIYSPQFLFGQATENAKNTVQFAKNILSFEQLEFLQYRIAIYEYLNSENALI